MMLIPGQVLLVNSVFVDGSESGDPRPFLIVNIDGNFAQALNVSSVKGKEHKLAFPSNVQLIAYDPPFRYPSFVKLDVLYEFEIFPELKNAALQNGRTLDRDQLSIILNSLSLYQRTIKKVQIVKLSKQDVVTRNPHLNPKIEAAKKPT